MASEVRWLCVFFIFPQIYDICTQQASSLPHRKFEYKFSFKSPYLAQKDGSIPFWEYGGNAIASAESVRICSSLRSQKGGIWTKNRTDFQWWEIDIIFRITGRGRIGADGLSLWFAESKGEYDGPVFGSSDKWVGLGLFFDSFDNDNKHNNPYIMAVVNDGTREFDHANDGGTQILAGCLRDFRNKPYPTRAKVEYYMKTLTVMFHNGMTSTLNEQDFEVCLRVENVILPESGHFGISAATGGLADDHDVLHFLTHSLYPPGQALPHGAVVPHSQVSQEEQVKLTQEYADYQKKLDRQKEDYRRDHPEAATKDAESEFEEWFESDSQRELRQIFTGQSQVLEQVRLLSSKLDEMVGRQERTLSLLSAIQASGMQHIPQVAGQPPHPGSLPMVDTIRRHEVETVLGNQNNIINAIREIRSFTMEVHSRADTIIQNQARAPTAQIQPVGYDMVSLVNELRDGINSVKKDAATTAQRLTSAPMDCPTVSCVSTKMLLTVAVVQVVIMLLYSLYRDNKESQAKKFY